jgi:hypothetical protein
MTVAPRDELMETLADLSGPAPRAARDARVRARCHAVLKGVGRPGPFARKARWALDRVLPAAVLIYGVVVVVEGLKLAGLL